MRLRCIPELRAVWAGATGSWRAYALLTAAVLTLGAVIAAGGTRRAMAPAWRFVYPLGGPLPFGLVLAVLGALLVAAPFLSVAVLRAVMMLAAIAAFALAIAFTGAAAVDPRASFVGGVLCAYLGLHLLFHREIYRAVTPR